MSEFVNYKKRSIALPSGCKNLIDVLRPRRAGGVRSGGASVGKLSETRKYVEMAFRKRNQMLFLAIGAPDDQLTVSIMQTGERSIRAYLYVQQNTPQDDAVGTFFKNHSLTVPGDTNMPYEFFPDAPVHRRYDISPVPTKASALANLIVDLFRDVLGLADDTQMQFRYDSIT